MKASILFITSFLLASTIYGNTFTVINSLDAGAGSLRQAIINVNASTDVTNSIIFNIPTTNPGYNSVTGVFTITLVSALPELRKSQVLIDGYSQVSFA